MSESNHRDSIETMGGPLAFSVTPTGMDLPEAPAETVLFRTAARALDGMQKEAIVASAHSSTAWRLVCDEGPYLNGTDLAPPPLAYFSAGMASCYADALLTVAKSAGTALEDVRIVQDNHYTMEGSAIRGTMIAGALPVDLSVQAIFADASIDARDLIVRGVCGSPVDALMRDSLLDTFSIVHNGTAIPTGQVAASSQPAPGNPSGIFSTLTSSAAAQSAPDFVSKLESTESVYEADHGSGAAMKDTQKRQLHIRSVLSLTDDGLRDIRVQIFKPIGSVFRFLSAAEGGAESAPSGLTLVSAGIAFCFMTQIGRYAGIVKKDLQDYGVVQDTIFDLKNGVTRPVDTHTYLESSEDRSTAQRYVDMGEQTCFVHGACRMSNKTRISVS